MNRILLYILFLGTLYGCSTDNIPTPINPEEEASGMEYTIRFSSNISYNISTESRAGIIEDTYLPQGSVTGIYALKTTWQEVEGKKVVQPGTWDVNNLQYDFKNEPYESEGSTGKFISQNGCIARFPSHDYAALNIYAYYPYSTTTIVYDTNKQDAPQLKVDIKQDASLTEDYLYTGLVDAYPTGESTTINLPFKHALTRLRFQIYTNDASFTDTYCHQLTKVVVKTNNNQSGYMNIENGAITRVKGNNTTFEYILSEPYDIVKRNERPTVAEFLLIPDENAINEIILYIQGEAGEPQPYTAYSFYPKKKDPKKLEAGCVHTVNVEYRSRASFECAITGWETETINNSDFDINDDNDMENENFEGVE